jgi:hypothetical protein
MISRTRWSGSFTSAREPVRQRRGVKCRAESSKKSTFVARRRLLNNGIDGEIGRSQQQSGLLQSLLAE